MTDDQAKEMLRILGNMDRKLGTLLTLFRLAFKLPRPPMRTEGKRRPQGSYKSSQA